MNASSLYRALFILVSWRLISMLLFFVPGGRGDDCFVRASWMIFLTSAPVTFSPVLARSTKASGLRRAWRGEQVEGADWQIQIPKFCGFGPLVYLHKVARRLLGPSEFLFQPWQPITMAAKYLSFDEPSANFDNVGSCSLVERADGLGMFRQLMERWGRNRGVL